MSKLFDKNERVGVAVRGKLDAEAQVDGRLTCGKRNVLTRSEVGNFQLNPGCQTTPLLKGGGVFMKLLSLEGFQERYQIRTLCIPAQGRHSRHLRTLHKYRRVFEKLVKGCFVPKGSGCAKGFHSI